ncbi:hypothetical protein BU15DRAFT_69089, partial [Melanogaster broomeanus]
QDPVTAPEETLDWPNGQPLISQLGGPVIYAFKVARFFGCIGFLGLALITPSKEIIATAVYVSVLGLLSVTTTYKYASLASQHLATVLLVVFSVFAYRDLFPLLTFNEQPEDVHEESFRVSHPEQTASWLSMSLYLWLDPHHIHGTTSRSIPELEKEKFSGDLVARCPSRNQLPSPVREIIQYTLRTVARERSSNHGFGSPWIFVGQFIGSVIFQWFNFFTARTIVRTEAIITQLIFEHALRIRMKAEIPDNVKGAESTVSTPDNASIAESNTVVEESSDSSVDEAQSSSTITLDSSMSNGKQKSKDKVDDAETQAKKPKSSADNLVGKINNLVTTDLGNIIDGRDFLLVCKVLVCQMSDVVSGSYTVSWVGGCFPLPGIIASRIQTAHSDDEDGKIVQTVTETIWMEKKDGGENQREAGEVELPL